MNNILLPYFKTTRRGMMVKLKVTSGRSQESSFVVITLYLESNCTWPGDGVPKAWQQQAAADS